MPKAKTHSGASKRTRRLDGRTVVAPNDTKRINAMLNG